MDSQDALAMLYFVPVCGAVVYVGIAIVQRCVRRRWLHLLYCACLVGGLVPRGVALISVFQVRDYSEWYIWATSCTEILLTATQLLSLVAWHDCAISFTTRGNAFKTEKYRFRKLTLAFLLVSAVLILAFAVWMTVEDVQWGDAQYDAENPLHKGKKGFALLCATDRLILSFAAAFWGIRLARRIRHHGIRSNTNLRKLQLLSFGAFVVWLSFFVRGVLIIAITESSSFSDWCHTYQGGACIYSFVAITELLPFYYFIVLFFLFAFWSGGQHQQHSTPTHKSPVLNATANPFMSSSSGNTKFPTDPDNMSERFLYSNT